MKEVTKLTGLCEMCKDGTEAVATIAMGEKTAQIEIDDRKQSKYVTVCHFHIGRLD
jgi:thymidine kinase